MTLKHLRELSHEDRLMTFVEDGSVLEQLLEEHERNEEAAAAIREIAMLTGHTDQSPCIEPWAVVHDVSKLAEKVRRCCGGKL